jgi:hypothetical protein
VIRSQIREWEVKAHLKRHILCIDYIVIQSQLKNLIGRKGLIWRKFGNAQKTADSVRFGFLIG